MTDPVSPKVENRKDKRFVEQDKVLIKAMGQARETAVAAAINASTHDISLTGARIHTKLVFPVGYVMRIIIDLKRTRHPLSVEGEVVWTRKDEDGKHYDIGVKFLHTVPDTILLLIANFYGKQAGIPSSIS